MNRKYGLKKEKLYKVWNSMKQRCYNPNTQKYKIYGGRGIDVCDEWKNDVKVFYDWAMANGYKEGLQIDRIDNNRGYSPDNCRFVTLKENVRNSRHIRWISYNNEIYTLSELCDKFGINIATVCGRIKNGMDELKAITTPSRKYKRV